MLQIHQRLRCQRLITLPANLIWPHIHKTLRNEKHIGTAKNLNMPERIPPYPSLFQLLRKLPMHFLCSFIFFYDKKGFHLIMVLTDKAPHPVRIVICRFATAFAKQPNILVFHPLDLPLLFTVHMNISQLGFLQRPPQSIFLFAQNL